MECFLFIYYLTSWKLQNRWCAHCSLDKSKEQRKCERLGSHTNQVRYRNDIWNKFISFMQGKMAGWIKLHRKVADRWRYTDANTARLFFHCLISANHKKTSWKWVEIDAWQFITSSEKLWVQLWLSRQQIRRCLDNLQNTQEITIKTTSKYTMITLVKYSDYQWWEDEAQPSKQPTNNQQLNQQTTTNKNEKNIKNEKKKEKERPLVELFTFEHRDKLKKEIGDMFEYERLQVYRNHLNSIVEMIELWHCVPKNKEWIVEMVEWCKSKISILGISSDERLYQTLKRKERHQNKWDEIKNHKNSLLTFFKPKWTQKK